MPSTQTLFDLLLPSLESIGLWSYWLIGLAALLEAFFLTGIVLPGSVVVILGGALVQRGDLDFGDLIWFVAAGSWIGAEFSFILGDLQGKRRAARQDMPKPEAFGFAARFFRRQGGMAIVLGRFIGPISGLVPFAAALAGLRPRSFLIWNAVGALLYALVYISVGFGLGEVLNRLGPLMTRIGFALAVAALVLGLVWYVISQALRSLPFVLALLWQELRAFLHRPAVATWLSRHPRVTTFAVARLDPTEVSGRTLTLLVLAMSYVLWVYLASALDLIMSDQIVQADTRLAALIHAFQTPGAIRVAAYMTALGDSRTVGLLFAGTLVALGLRGRLALGVGLLVAVAGDLVTVSLLKLAFARPRPEFAYFLETSGSFPSGHAAISVAFYGFAAYAVWRVGLLRPLPAALAATTIAFAIGMSRIYLIEHYLSDVLNGYLVGIMWLLIAISVSELLTHRLTRPALLPRWGAATVLALGLVGASWTVVTYDKARAVVVGPLPVETVTGIPAIFADKRAAVFTETLFGTPQEPINVVIVAKDADALRDALALAGWEAASAPAFGTLLQAALLAWTNQPDPTAPVTPYFWEGNPNDLAFQHPDQTDTARRRHHVRFWSTRFVAAPGGQVFVGSASFDDGLKWGLTHHISPDLDAERTRIARDILAALPATGSVEFQITAALKGQDLYGDPWFTAGKAVVLTLEAAAP